jgi:hypothetical protein
MITRLTIALAVGVALPVVAANAQTSPDTASILSLQGENASITGGQPTDRLYTNGLRLSLTLPDQKLPTFLADLGRTLWGEGQQRIGFGISQQIYTPVDTTVVPADPRDRPYAGYLSANISLLSDTDQTRSLLMLSLGLVGPGSGGEGLQDDFHNLLGQSHDLGWGSQIPNTPAIELLHERTWRLPIVAAGGIETDFLSALSIGIGDVRDYLQVGGTFRIGQGLDSDFGVPRVRPGLSGGEVYRPTRPFAWYLFAGVDGQAVAYDLLLEAAPFRSGPHVDATWDVAEFQGGAAIMAYGVRLTLAYVAQTQEFEGQRGGIHQFGSASLSVRF